MTDFGQSHPFDNVCIWSALLALAALKQTFEISRAVSEANPAQGDWSAIRRMTRYGIMDQLLATLDGHIGKEPAVLALLLVR